MKQLEPRTTPTIEDLKVWEETTRRMLNIPQRTINFGGDSGCCATELWFLRSIIRMRSFAEMDNGPPPVILEKEARLIAKRLSEIVNVNLEIKIVERSSEEISHFNILKEFFTGGVLIAEPCPWCGSKLLYGENNYSTWLRHPSECNCILAGTKISTAEVLKKWNCRAVREQLDIEHEDEDYELTEEERLEAIALQKLEMKPCPFCSTRLVYEQKYGVAALTHPDNGCFCAGINIGIQEAVKEWNDQPSKNVDVKIKDMPHADLECPHCGKMCKPKRNNKDGGASYRCNNSDAHDDFSPLPFRIDGDGEVHW